MISVILSAALMAADPESPPCADDDQSCLDALGAEMVEMPAEEAMPQEPKKYTEAETREILGIVYDDLENYWTVYKGVVADECQAIRRYNGSIFNLHYNARTKVVTWMFTDAHSSSLREGDRRGLDIVMGSSDTDELFRKPLKTYRGKIFTISESFSPKTERKFTANFDKALLEALSVAGTVVLFYEGKTVNAYPLNGSARAIAALRQCANTAAHIDPEDVFAQ